MQVCGMFWIHIDYTGFLPVLDPSDLLDEDSSGFGLASAIGSSFDISATARSISGFIRKRI